MKRVLCALAVLLIALQNPVKAHEVRPAYLRITETAPDHYETLWRVPARGDLRLGIYLEMPEKCQRDGAQLNWSDGRAFVEKNRWTCIDGLAGGVIRISGLDALMTDALARFERLDGTTQIVRLTPSENTFEVTAAQGGWAVAGTYFSLGMEHILLGIDHLLFVLALLFLVPGPRMLFWTITSFTLAHSVTLAAATLGWVHVPQQPVEAIIALSILFVATEVVHWKQGRPGISRRWPWLVAFVFGLLHGFGFAGALTEIGLPEHAIPLALLFFNLGVEAGQLVFIGLVLLLWFGLKRLNWPSWGWMLPVYSIGATAAFWTIERLFSITA